MFFLVNEYTILVYFEKKLTGKNDTEGYERCQELESSELKLFDHLKIARILISYGQNLSDRDSNSHISVCYNLYAFLQKTLKGEQIKRHPHTTEVNQSQYSKHSDIKSIKRCEIYDFVTQHELALNDGYDDPGGLCALYCSAPQNYVFEIAIPKHILENTSALKRLIDMCHLKERVHIPLIYERFYQMTPSVGDLKELKILGTDTKIRRIGYLKLLADFLKQYKSIPKGVINKKFERFVAPFEKKLNQYKNSKGVVRITKSGISAKPYIDLARSSELLTYLNGLYSTGKLFKVYIHLKQDLSNKNTFDLSLFDKLFFGEHLLRRDFLFLTSLLELIFIYGPDSTNYDQMKRCFQPYILKKLEEIKKQRYGLRQISKADADKLRHRHPKRQQNGSKRHDIIEYQLTRKELSKIDNIYQRIRNWKKAHVYLEHVLMPRLNWLLDLDLIRLDKKLNIELTPQGLRFFYHMCAWHDLIFERIVSPEAFLDRFSSRLFSDVYQVSNTPLASVSDDVAVKIVGYVNASFELFRTLAPNRVTASQAVYYTRYQLFFKDQIAADCSDIIDFLQDDRKLPFSIKIQKNQKDGYIQKTT